MRGSWTRRRPASTIFKAQSAGDFVLAVVATGLALTATQLRPVLAIPFLLGAISVGCLGMQA